MDFYCISLAFRFHSNACSLPAVARGNVDHAPYRKLYKVVVFIAQQVQQQRVELLVHERDKVNLIGEKIEMLRLCLCCDCSGVMELPWLHHICSCLFVALPIPSKTCGKVCRSERGGLTCSTTMITEAWACRFTKEQIFAALELLLSMCMWHPPVVLGCISV